MSGVLDTIRDEKKLQSFVTDVKELMGSALKETTLRFLLNDCKNLIGSGKMLRSRLVYRVGTVTGVPYDTLVHAAGAVDMIHAASLLHDDVIDGGCLRRSEPTFWVERGIPGAILVGDLLLFKALDLTCQVDNPKLTQELVKCCGEVCQGESEQELLHRGEKAAWDVCLSIARNKTGALFAFAGYACGGDDPTLCATLEEAGYQVGTAYQLADDILDACATEKESGKTSGTDSARSKLTAMLFMDDDKINPVANLRDLCEKAHNSLQNWPEIQQAWATYMELDLTPSIDKVVMSGSRLRPAFQAGN